MGGVWVDGGAGYVGLEDGAGEVEQKGVVREAGKGSGEGGREGGDLGGAK